MIPCEANVQVSGRFPLRRDFPALGGAVGTDGVGIEVIEEIHRLESAVVHRGKGIGQFWVTLALQWPNGELRLEIRFVGDQGARDVFHHAPHGRPDAGEERSESGGGRGHLILVILQIEAAVEETEANSLVGSVALLARQKGAIGVSRCGVRRKRIRLGIHE